MPPMSHPVASAIRPAVRPPLSSGRPPGKWRFHRPPVSAGGRGHDVGPARLPVQEPTPAPVAPGIHANGPDDSLPRRFLPGIFPGALLGFLPSSPISRRMAEIWIVAMTLWASGLPAAARPETAVGVSSGTPSQVPPEPGPRTMPFVRHESAFPTKPRVSLESTSRTSTLVPGEPTSRMPFHSSARSNSQPGFTAASLSPSQASFNAASRSQSQVTVQDGRFEGRVVAPDGKPLAGVLVHQPGGVASALTDEQGRFFLRLDPAAQARLSFSAVGYLACEVPLPGAGSVTLQPVPVYRPGFKPLAPEPEPAERPFFDSQLGLHYRVRYQSVTGRSHLVEGWASNDLAGFARLRAAPVVLGLEGFRFKAPLTLAPLAAQVSPQPTVENTQWAAWLGYPLSLGGIEWLLQAGYVTSYWVPGNQGTPWTGTPLDFGQTRQGAALALEAGHAFGALDVSARVAYIPALATVLSGAPYSVGDLRSTEVVIGAGYEVLPGLRLGLNVARQWANGTDLDEWANVFGLSATYLPERVRP